MMVLPTVNVTPIDDHNALLMSWDSRPNQRDVSDAFQQINAALEKAQSPLYVVVDLRANPAFPLQSTIFGALPAYRHPMLHQWLIVGKNRAAQIIESTLSISTRRKNVLWFDTMEAALAHLAQAGD